MSSKNIDPTSMNIFEPSYSQFKIKESRSYHSATGINFSCALFASVTEAAKNSYQQHCIVFKLDRLYAVAKPTRHLAVSLLAGLFLLSGCQPSDSLSAIDVEKNNSSVNNASSDNNAVSAANNDAFSAIAPSYVEGVADAPMDEATASATTCKNAMVVNAFKAKQSDRQVKGCGSIIKALPDDNKGSRHQKILIELDGVSPRQTLLLVHNIDLAPRVADVSKGTALKFYGEYVYNNKGGLVHWTHHDPAARHQSGWIESGGVRYQ